MYRLSTENNEEFMGNMGFSTKKNMEELWKFYGIHSEKYWRNCSEVKLKVQTL